jgi:transposase
MPSSVWRTDEVYEVTIRDALRDWVLVQGRSQRSAAHQFDLSRDTVARLLTEPAAGRERRYQRQQPRPAPKRDAVRPHLERWLAENARLQRVAPKQRWTARRMWSELRQLGIEIAEPTVRRLVREVRLARQQPRVVGYVPLTFAAGERAEFDFGHAVVELGGQEVSQPFLAGRLRYSGAMFVEVFPTERQDAFLLGQRHAFEFWGGVPRTVVYDNLTPAVQRILRGHQRQEQEAFTHFHSAYGFEAIFANPAAGWEKGSVENLVGYARRTYLVPIPRAASLDALNAWLRGRCVEDQQRVMAGREQPIATALAVEHAALTPLPAHPVEVGDVREVVVRSTGRVRYATNWYSVPTRYAGRRLTLKADPFQVRLYAGGELVATHARTYGHEQVVEDFRHYVPLLVEKPFAVPFASALRSALATGQLPGAWETFRQELVARRADSGQQDGNREFARILHLCLTHSVAEVGAALELAAASGRYSADAVRQLLTWAEAPAAASTPLDPARYPQYQQSQPRPDLTIYNRLLSAGSAGHAASGSSASSPASATGHAETEGEVRA